MRRAGLHGSTATSVALTTPALVTLPNNCQPATCEPCELPIATEEPAQTHVVLSPGGTFVAERPPADRHAERRRDLTISIRQRIESRLGGRVRDLVVRVVGQTVVLEGKCATYYTKQLAQHAALAILEDEQLENAISVGVTR